MTLVGQRVVSVLLAVLVMASTALVFAGTSAKPAGASTVFASGQVFASVGSASVSVYDPATANQINTLTDSTGSALTGGSAFDAKGDLYVADYSTGQISEYGPDGTPMGVFASGLNLPLSPVFDQAGNLYVGQQGTPYITEFSSSGGSSVAKYGPVTTPETGDDWIDLEGDQCTFLYTSETDEIYSYNKCTHTQQAVFNQAPLPGSNAYQLKILSNGDVLVADTDAVVLLDSSGNQIQSYPCSSLSGCAGGIFNVAVDPSGTSFWTDDFFTGLIWQVDMATGNVMQTISTNATYLYGLSVDYGYTAAATQTVVSATPTTLTVPQVTWQFFTPTQVSAVLTDSATGTPIPNEPVTLTLNTNATESCTATTDSTGTATCVITPIESSGTYTLSASFAGDSSQSASIGSDSSTTAVIVLPDNSSLTYTGPTTAVNGQPLTLTGTLTTDTPTTGTPLPNKTVTFTIGSGSTVQSCMTLQSLADGTVSCTIPTVNQPVSNVSIGGTFSGDAYDTSASVTPPVVATVTEPTSLQVKCQSLENGPTCTSDFSDGFTAIGVLTDTVTNAPVVGEPVTLTLDGHETCSGTTDATGTASCSITPGEPAATYTLTGSFAGDVTQPLQLMAATGSTDFVVTLEETALSYTGPTVAHNGQPLTLSGVLTTDDPSSGTGVVGRTVTLTLGSGGSVQACTGTTDPTGAVSCTIASVNQSPGPIPVTASFAGDAYYQVASVSATVNLPEGTELTVNPVTGTYNGSIPVTATLVNTYTNPPTPVAGEPVTLTLNGTQTCTATTNSAGVASCAITPNEPAGTYSLTATFSGDNSSVPQLVSTSSSTTFTVTAAQTWFTYTGTTSVTNGGTATLSGVLTTNEPTGGTDVSGRTVTFTLGSGSSQQSCTAVTIATGAASCTVSNVNQTSGTAGISATFGGDTYYQSSSASSSAVVHTPTTLTVNAGTSDFADAGILSGVLTNSITGVPIAGKTVALALNATQTCSAVTNSSGVASCTVTPNEPAGTYAVTASFGGDSTVSPQLLASTGTNQYVVTHEETAITYTGPSIAVSGMPITLSANLTTDGNPLGGRAVIMTLGSGTTAQSCTGTTNTAGNATCTIANVNQTAGSVPIAVSFAGDSYYRPASASGTETTAAAPDAGGFVVGDVTAGAPTLGTSVNFWGSQFWKNNQFSGVVNAPASMKGYIDNAPGFACGVNWTSDPGNSSHPPSTIPVNMVVVVSSTITQSGSVESGNIKHLVVVSVNPGYGPAPGHDGWGKIIGTIC